MTVPEEDRPVRRPQIFDAAPDRDTPALTALRNENNRLKDLVVKLSEIVMRHVLHRTK